ncbi:MAG TPA: TlpA disulfide reductase family protein [Bryobacteraceae bacterium]|nr:TlpA disulfide reductase family protein [Bryobacteraceae bacterium]
MRFWLVILTMPLSAAVVSEVRNKISAGDLTSADAIADEFCRIHGPNSECAAATSWLARGALNLHDYPLASRYLTKTKTITADLLKSTRVEDDNFLTAAVGAQFEAEARLLAAQGARDKAVALLNTELAKSPSYDLHARIQKNLNLLTLEGKPAPHLEPGDKGKVVLLFLWGHWCGDCAAQAAILARIHQRYPSVAIRTITRRVGFAKGIENPTPAQEDADRERVWKETYHGLDDVSHPVNEAAMLDYGASSTPTFVLIDRGGIVRMYKPFRFSEAELARQIERVLGE